MDKKRENELKVKIGVVRRRLLEMKEYKKLIAADGLEPDRDDKLLETELIKRLLWLEKQLAGPKAPRRPEKTKVAPPACHAKTRVSNPKRPGKSKTKASKRKGS